VAICQFMIFWDMTLFLTDEYWHYGGKRCLHPQFWYQQDHIGKL
jgi:hypothetical protein